MPIKKIQGTVQCSDCKNEFKWEVHDRSQVKELEFFELEYTKGYEPATIQTSANGWYSISAYCPNCGFRNIFTQIVNNQ